MFYVLLRVRCRLALFSLRNSHSLTVFVRRNELLGGKSIQGNPPKTSSKRAWGVEETPETQGLDNDGLFSAQQQIVKRTGALFRCTCRVEA
jgi:hypothetical protein